MTRTISVTSDRATIRKTLAIRASAHERLGSTPEAHCPICTRPCNAPFYRKAADYEEGCVDACHAQHITPATNYSHWYYTNSAKRARRALARAQGALAGPR